MTTTRSYYYFNGSEGCPDGQPVDVENSAGDGSNTPWLAVQTAGDDSTTDLIWTSERGGRHGSMAMRTGVDYFRSPVWVSPPATTMQSARCALLVPSPSPDHTGQDNSQSAETSFMTAYIDVGDRDTYAPQQAWGLSVIDAATSRADDTHFALILESGGILTGWAATQTGPSLPCDTWLDLRVDVDFTALQIGLTVTNADTVIFANTQDFGEIGDGAYGHYSSYAVAYGAVAVGSLSAPLYQDDCVLTDERTDTSTGGGGTGGGGTDPGGGGTGTGGSGGDDTVTDLGSDDTVEIPCPTEYRSVVASHTPTAVPSLGVAVAYRALVTDRGGRTTVLDLPPEAISAVSWQRKCNDVAEHTITLTKRDPAGRQAALALLEVVECWVHELAIWRIPDRDQPQLVALGPLVDWTESRTDLTLTVNDLSAWFGKRVLHTSYNFTGCHDLAEIARWLINDALAPDDPGILPFARFIRTGIEVDRAGAAFTLMIDKELADLCDLGLDYVFVGRRLYVSGDLAAQWPHIARLGENDFDVDVEINGAGSEALTRVFKHNDQSDDAFLGYAGGVDSVLGLLETTDADDDLTSNAACRTAAKMALAAAYPVPYYVRIPDGAGLTADAPVTMNQLIPGVGIIVSIPSYIKPRIGLQRLTQVKVDWTAQDGERVAVSLSPWAAPIADDATVVASAADLGTADLDVETDPSDALYVGTTTTTTTTTTGDGGDGDDTTTTTDSQVAHIESTTSSVTYINPSIIEKVSFTAEEGQSYWPSAAVTVDGAYSGYPMHLDVRLMAGSPSSPSDGVSIWSVTIGAEYFGYLQALNAYRVALSATSSGTWTAFVVGSIAASSAQPGSTTFICSASASQPQTLTVTRLGGTSTGTGTGDDTTTDDTAESQPLDPITDDDEDADQTLNATSTTDGTDDDDSDGTTDDDTDLSAGDDGGDDVTDDIGDGST